jgi:A/G-specific adenine glycosylase
MRAPKSQPSAQAIANRIARWFDRHQRDLPWRRTRDPYAIWISEIMLQQTQVATVIPYFERWMREFPTVESFAAAPIERVLKLWEGLGYYRRARHAHAAAQVVVKQYNGRFPRDLAEVLALPGIGRYTAGAICSLAFNAPTPILDGNVIRVLTRLHGIAGNPREKKTNAQLWALAESLVQSSVDRSSLNQGLMELGALICAPRAPRCEACPVASLCEARRTGRVEILPMPDKRPATTNRRFHAFIVRRGERFLVSQRPSGVVNGLLWEFPNVEHPAPVRHFEPTQTEPFLRITHSITRYRILLEAFPARLMSRRAPAGACWRTREEMEQLPFASAHRKILQRLP